MAEQPRSFRRGPGHAAELRAGDVGNAVMLGELPIEEGVVRTPELDRVAVVTQLAEQEQFASAGAPRATHDGQDHTGGLG